MMIDRIFQTCKTFINTDGVGNFRPTDFELALYNSILEKQESYIYEINQQTNRENRGLINGTLENVPDKLREKLLHYLTTSTISYNSGLYSLPNDCKYFDSLFDSDGNSFEFQKNMQEFDIVKNVVASTKYPIALKIGDKIKVAPSTINSVLTLYYLRTPKFPKWTYTVVFGNETFNPSASDFQDVDIHPSEEDDLIQRICFKFGVNLKDIAVQRAMLETEQIENQQNNAS